MKKLSPPSTRALQTPEQAALRGGLDLRRRRVMAAIAPASTFTLSPGVNRIVPIANDGLAWISTSRMVAPSMVVRERQPNTLCVQMPLGPSG